MGWVWLVSAPPTPLPSPVRYDWLSCARLAVSTGRESPRGTADWRVQARSVLPDWVNPAVAAARLWLVNNVRAMSGTGIQDPDGPAMVCTPSRSRRNCEAPASPVSLTNTCVMPSVMRPALGPD